MIYCGGIFDWDNALKRLDELNSLCEDPDLWNYKSKAQKLLKEKTYLENSINASKKLEVDLEDNIGLIILGKEEDDEQTVKEAENSLIDLAEKIRKQKTEFLFSGEADVNNCFLEIHAGAGGTESQDWVEMLLRMYLRWSEMHDFKYSFVNKISGEEAGLKSVAVKISGHNAYGWCKTESGVHRLVRISPFDSNSRRHTSFASVWVYPEVDDTIEIEIEEKDLRVDTFRASGAGGQHVNKTDSAIRITHIPTNIVVQCQDSRSQHRNRAEAMNMLKARLYELELQKQEEEKNAENKEKKEIGWGHQIRSYVLHPYQMIKDLRTNYETSNTSAVLNGDLDDFIIESLSQRVAGNKK